MPSRRAHPKKSRTTSSETTPTATMASTTIPSTFLKGPAPRSVHAQRLRFANTRVPQYAHCWATVIDNALSPEECTQLLRMAVATTPNAGKAGSGGGGDDAGPAPASDVWQRAMINVGGGRQMLATEARNCGRIIWDSPDVVQRLWERIAPHVPELRRLQGEAWAQSAMRVRQQLLRGGAEPAGYGSVLTPHMVQTGGGWRCVGLNERMRFLRYVGGEYFRPHCDGVYETPDGRQRSFFTLHLYLNDVERESPFVGEADCPPDEPDEPLKGGATTFHSPEDLFMLQTAGPEEYGLRKREDVEPKVGRVLLFQHRDLIHSGDDVVAGVKYTMRTDIMFEREEEEEEEE